MTHNLLLLAVISLLSLGSLRAQRSASRSGMTTVDAAQRNAAQQADATDTEEFHYRDGAYGYRAEAQLIDSLAVLEMMGEVTPTEAQQEKEKFRKAKKNKQRAKKEKMREKRKKKKNKKKKAKKN